MKRIVKLILGMVLLTGTMAAQDMFISSGAEGKSDKASLTWVVGGGISVSQNDASPVLTPEFYESQKTALSLKANLPAVEVGVFPNPVTEYVTVSVKNDRMKGGKVYISDMSGKNILSGELEKENTKLIVSSLASGIYTVNTFDRYGNNSGATKIVKN
ncbi:T9SS type A sorting domain-containing protein [Saccharicrinis sp. FJH54]|uniref:T9SS type A sorting domain-containing protein n=1 Tax=Saccharicrinis sp. FJH54 TaxID=3344665 RepID=UPI0035D4EE4B